jgi:hypothetical protein
LAEQIIRNEWVVVNSNLAALVIGFDRGGFLVRLENPTFIYPGDIVRRRGYRQTVKTCCQTDLGDWWLYPEENQT